MVAHCGGEDDLPETFASYVRSSGGDRGRVYQLEARFALTGAAGEQPLQADLVLYSRLVNTLRRICEVLGWRQTARDITPSLDEYLRSKLRDTENAQGEADA